MIKFTIFIYIVIFFLFNYFLIEAQELGYVKKCYDGDTIKVVIYKNLNNSKYKKKYTKIVRVLGVDTFESRENKRAILQAKKNKLTIDEIIRKGQKATELCKKDWLFKKVIVDCWKKDKYDRNLCYVKDSNTNEDFGEYMIRNNVGSFLKIF